ncbi:MAG: hypothetical protein ABIV39_11045, partial [Verrucomicrobiota bacterium]
MKTYFLLLALWIGLGAGSSGGADIPTKPLANRFLFVVETSASTSRSAKSSRETIRALIESGVQGQMRPGDALALWTFNEQLYTSFPMQQWSPAVSQQIGERTDEFMKKIRFEKKGQLNVMMPSLESVVQDSKALTVILISSGQQPIQGTPFDSEINSIYSVYARSARDSKMPFVTILLGRNGKLATYAVNTSGDTVQIPNLPLPAQPELSLAKTNGLASTNGLTGSTTNQAAPPRKFAKSNIILSKQAVTNQPPATNLLVAPIVEVKSILETTNTPNTTSATNPAPSPARVAPPALETNSISSAAKILTEAALALSAVGTPGATGVSTQAKIVSQPLPLNLAKKTATPEPKEIRAEKIEELPVPK